MSGIWRIRIERKKRHPSQDRTLVYWFRRIFRRWIYPHSTQIRFLRGVEDHYGQLHEWITQMEPDHARQIWLVIDRMGVDDQRRPMFLQGQIRFRSRELHTAFLLRFPVDTDQGYAII